MQTEDMRGGGETEEYLRNRRQISEKEETERMIQQADELFFHYHYRRLLSAQGEQEVAEFERFPEVHRRDYIGHETRRKELDKEVHDRRMCASTTELNEAAVEQSPLALVLQG